MTERILEFWPKGTSYVKAVKAEKVSDPTMKSFDVMKERTTDILVQAKLSFFFIVAEQLVLFLTLYRCTRQTGQCWYSSGVPGRQATACIPVW